MNIVKVSDVPIAQTPHKVDVRKLFDSEHVQLVHIKLGPGESLKKHITPVDVTFYVLEGEGKVLIGEEERKVEKDKEGGENEKKESQKESKAKSEKSPAKKTSARKTSAKKVTVEKAEEKQVEVNEEE